MSSSSDDKKRRSNKPSLPSWVLDSAVQKIIKHSNMHMLPETIRSEVAITNRAMEAINSEEIANASLASRLVAQQQSLTSEILGRHGEMFAAVEAATRHQQEIGHATRAAIESMRVPEIGAVAQAMRMISPLMDSNQFTPPGYTAAYASMLESNMVARAGAIAAIESIHNLTQMGEIASIASGLRVSHLTIPNLDLVTGNVSRLMQDLLAGVEEHSLAKAHELRERYDDVVEIEETPEKTIKTSHAAKRLELILLLLLFFMDLYSMQAAHNESILTAEYREENLKIQRDLLTEFHTINHHLQKANGMDPEQASGLTEYVVLRSVNLRTHQGTGPGSHIITTLHPNQKVKLIQRGASPYKKWIYVSYHDHIEGIPRYGWVYKKYLKRVGS